MERSTLRTRAALAGAGVMLGAALSVSVLWAPASTAQVSAPLLAAGAGRVEFADLIEHVSPAVVNIAVEKTVRPASFNERNPLEGTPFQYFFERGQPRGLPERRAGGVGSGFIIDADGFVVTNHHVVAGAETVTVTMTDGEQYEADVIGEDPSTDLAVLKIKADEALPHVPFGDSDAARVGEWVVAIGNPFGLGGTATAGIISARGRDINSGPYDDYLQIDAPVNRGNSGGPVFNTEGEVIGVNTAIYSPNGGSVGIGFAIPATQVSAVVADLRQHGEVRRGWLGVEIQRVNDDIADSLGLGDVRGALVAAVTPDSPAEKAGVEVGDVIVSFDEAKIDGPKALSRAVAATDAGARSEVTVWRNGRERALKVRIGERDDDLLADLSRDASPRQDSDLGVSLARIDRDARVRFNLDRDVEGVVVVDVEPGSAAARRGLRPGDVISMVNQTPVKSPADVRDLLGEAREQDRDSVLALVHRGNSRRFVALGLG